MNERIRVPEVRVIGEDNEQIGVLKTRDALAMARSLNVDLVEVAPNAIPPVCRLLDYGKYRYEQGKKEKEARKSQKVIVVKEVRLRPKIDDHDLETKSKQARVFLEEGHKVKMTVLFRGREMAHQEIGREVLNQMIDLLKDSANIEQMPRVEGRNMTMLLSKGSPAKAAASTENRAPRPPRPEQAAPVSGTPTATPEQPAPAPAPVAAAIEPVPAPTQVAAAPVETQAPAPAPVVATPTVSAEKPTATPTVSAEKPVATPTVSAENPAATPADAPKVEKPAPAAAKVEKPAPVAVTATVKSKK